MIEMRRRGHSEELIRKLVFENPLKFLMQSGKFELPRLGIHTAVPHTALELDAHPGWLRTYILL